MSADATAPVGASQLRSIVARIEVLEGEKAERIADIHDIYAEAKSNGFDPVALRAVVRLRRKAASERAEFDAILDLYMAQLDGVSV